MPVIREKHIARGRKEHVCVWCKKIIPVGAPKIELFGMAFSDDPPYTIYEHEECHRDNVMIIVDSEG